MCLICRTISQYSCHRDRPTYIYRRLLDIQLKICILGLKKKVYLRKAKVYHLSSAQVSYQSKVKLRSCCYVTDNKALN